MNKIIHNLSIDNFKPHEFHSERKGDKWIHESPYADEWYIAPDLVYACQWLRNKMNCSLRINSGFRSLRYNRSIGSNDSSQHTGNRACAVDIACPNLLFREKLIYYVGMFNASHDNINLGGKGVYAKSKFYHLDLAGDRWWRGD